MFTILVAIDGSARASGVLEASARIARAMHARLVLYRAVYVPSDFPPAAATIHADTLPAYLDREAHNHLASLIASVPDLQCDMLVEEARQPWRAILAASDKVGADLIVLGSHGYHGWDHVLGTTAGKVANVAHRNVMIVHEPPSIARVPADQRSA